MRQAALDASSVWLVPVSFSLITTWVCRATFAHMQAGCNNFIVRHGILKGVRGIAANGGLPFIGG
jgi:hypothetical protein